MLTPDLLTQEPLLLRDGSRAVNRFILATTLLLLAGCLGQPSPTGGTHDRPLDNVVASPAPRGVIDPPVPFIGQQATVRLSALPPNASFELWLVPTHLVFRFGIPHPGQAGGVKLGEARSDAEGRLAYSFEMKPEYPRNNGTEVGKAGIWLVYPQPKVLAPAVVSWEAANPTVFQGKVYDESGKPTTSARVRLTVTGGFGEGKITYFQQEVEARDGAYRFDQVPAPADTEIEVVLPSGLSRKRFDRTGGMQIKWGCCDGNAWLNNYGQPLTYNFGGPATPEDPLAPGYFVSERMADAAIATTTLTGSVYDQLGRLVPDEAKAIVIAQPDQHWEAMPDRLIARVTGGRYSLKVPTGVVSLDLRVEPGVHVLIHGPAPRVFLPEALTGKPATFNFGGPATSDQPDAPQYAFPSPQPVLTGPSPFVPAGP
jgi:hypothetical protein